MMLSLPLYIAAILLLFPVTGWASTFAKETFTCPIGGEVFEAYVPVTGSQFGKMLDLKPYGAIATPYPHPVCPGNGFVMYKKEFTEDDINNLTPFILSPTYQAHVNTETPYFRLATIYEHLERDALTVAHTWLKATWEAKATHYDAYATRAIQAFTATLRTETLSEKERATGLIVLVELKRRIGDFEGAQEVLKTLQQETQQKVGLMQKMMLLLVDMKRRIRNFMGLQKTPEMPRPQAPPAKKESVIQKMMTLQRALIADKDQAPHTIP
jgi:hypothetical protein